jgi:HisJ family histidinol phosphate phosphatase
MTEDPRIAALPDIHGHAKGEHKPFSEERPIPYTARMLFLWFYHACRRGSPRFLMVADHMNYLTFEDPAAVNLVRRALKLAQAGDLYGAAETAGVELAHAATVSEGLRRGLRYSIGAEVDNDPRCRPDAQNIVDAMRPDGMIRSVHFLPIAHPQHGENWMWPFDNPEFAELYELVGTERVWEIYMATLLEAIDKLPGHIVAHFYVPAKFGHWPEDAALETYEDSLVDACAERGLAIEINSRYLYKFYANDEAQLERYRTAHLRLLAKAKAKGVAIAVGSDAHSPKDQGRAFDAVLALLDEAEINEIAFPINGRLARVALRATEEILQQRSAAATAPPVPAGTSANGSARPLDEDDDEDDEDEDRADHADGAVAVAAVAAGVQETAAETPPPVTEAASAPAPAARKKRPPRKKPVAEPMAAATPEAEAEQPSLAESATGDLVPETLAAAETVAEAAVVEASVVEEPIAEAPVAEAPVADVDVAEAPVADAHVAEAPVADAHVAKAPVGDAHVAEAPVADVHVAEAPIAETVADVHVAEATVAQATVADESAVIEASGDLGVADEVPPIAVLPDEAVVAEVVPQEVVPEEAVAVAAVVEPSEAPAIPLEADHRHSDAAPPPAKPKSRPKPDAKPKAPAKPPVKAAAAKAPVAKTSAAKAPAKKAAAANAAAKKPSVAKKTAAPAAAKTAKKAPAKTAAAKSPAGAKAAKKAAPKRAAAAKKTVVKKAAKKKTSRARR